MIRERTMNRTTSQNGVSRLPLYGQRHNRTMRNNQSSQDEPKGSSLSDPSSHLPVNDMSVSKHKIREVDVFHSREVFLKLLKPPALQMPRSGCSLPYREKAKTCFKSEVSESHCSRCLEFRPPHNQLVVSSGANGGWNSKTLNVNCDSSEMRDGQQNISYKETNEKQPHREPRTVINWPGNEDDQPPRTGKTSVLFSPPVRCRSCDLRGQSFYPEELHLRTGRCQQVLEERQQHSNGNHCFREDTFSNDADSAPSNKEKPVEDSRSATLNNESSRKDTDKFRHACPSKWRYYGYNSRFYRPLPLSRNLSPDHPGMVTESNDEHLRPVRSVNNVIIHLGERSPLASSSVTQDKGSETSHPVPERYVYPTSLPSDELLQGQCHEVSEKR